MRARLQLRTSAVTGTLAGVALVVTTGYASEGCRTPTQVTIELSTFADLSCTALDGIDIVVAQKPLDAEAKMKGGNLSTHVERGVCGADGHTIGTLVLTPSGSSGAILVRARLRGAPADATCEPPDYKGCIVARRAFSFVTHASLTMPISLEAACKDVPCSSAESCRSGICVDSTASCSESAGTCSSPADPLLAPDGGVILPDGATASDASTGDSGDGGALDAAGDADAATLNAGTNRCPTLPDGGGAVDCAELYTDGICCGDVSFSCTGSPMKCNGLKLACTGTRHCAPGWVCCPDPVTNSSACASSCPLVGTLCSETTDCPPYLDCAGTSPFGVLGASLTTCMPR